MRSCICRALGYAVQVSLPIVRQFVKNVEEKALGVKVIKGVKPDQMLVRVVNDELVELMGGAKEDLVDPDEGPQVRLQTLEPQAEQGASAMMLTVQQSWQGRDPPEGSEYPLNPLMFRHFTAAYITIWCRSF